ncbi:uncharacterized protein [Epargyreus clarus]|uniref:uncharacterized protein n=1 Tax=Epargyreus clarus TaxID=520877 RepID=UPI003C2C9121
MDKLSPKIQETINKIIKEEGYTNQNMEVLKVVTDGASYQGVLYEVNVRGQTDNGDKETNIFIKHLIENYENFKLYSVLEVYDREAFVYNELAKVFKELQDEAEVPLKDRYKIVKSYRCSTEAIILENIAKKGYKTYPRMNVMTLKLAELSVEQLAKFHALTFALKVKRPDYFNNKITTIKQSMVFDDVYRDFIKKMFEISLENLDEARKEKVANYFPTLVENFPKYVQGAMTDVKCLCHGDYRISNIMIKENDGVIADVIPIDYQQMYYGAPVLDFIYLIFGASDRQFRKNHLNHLKEFYFETVGNFLKYFQVDVSSVYPREEFEKDFKNCLDYGLMFSLYFMPFFFALEDDSPDLNEELLELSLKLDPRFKDRLQGIIDDFVEWGHL